MTILEAIVVTFIGMALGILLYKCFFEKTPKETEEYLELLDGYAGLKTKYLELLDEYSGLKTKIFRYQVYITALERQAERSTKIVREVPKGTIDAVKWAMKMSHPDNNGNRDDFEKYKRAYLILTGKEKI